MPQAPPRRGHCPPPRWATRGSSRVWGRAEGKGHLLNHLLHHLPVSLPSSLSFSRYEIFCLGVNVGPGQEPPSSQSP